MNRYTLAQTLCAIAIALGAATSAQAQISSAPQCAMTKAAYDSAAKLGHPLPTNATHAERHASDEAILLALLAYERAAAAEPGCDDRNALDKFGDQAHAERLLKSLSGR